jgi:type II secretory pathway component PulK
VRRFLQRLRPTVTVAPVYTINVYGLDAASANASSLHEMQRLLDEHDHNLVAMIRQGVA